MSYNPKSYQDYDPESGDVHRQRLLVRPERTRIDLLHPRYHYTQVANQESSHIRIMPLDTGANPARLDEVVENDAVEEEQGHEGQEGVPLMEMANRGREVFGLNDEYSPLKRTVIKEAPAPVLKSAKSRKFAKLLSNFSKNDRQGSYPWKVYCYIVTFWAPGPLLRLFGIKSPEAQFAWREKIGLLSCIGYCAAFIVYIVFGFTRTVCKAQNPKLRNNSVPTSYLILNGKAYDLSHSQHPKAAGISSGANILYPPINAGGMDASFLFQNVNGNCKGLIKARDNSSIPHSDDYLELAWYMPCRLYNQDGLLLPNFTESYYNGWACHTLESARKTYYDLKVTGDVYFTWGDIKNSLRNLVVYNGDVLDLDLIDWFQTDLITYPTLFDSLRSDSTLKGHDISIALSNSEQRHAAKCLSEVIKVGSIDLTTIGCLASNVVLYVSLVFILAIVLVKFLMAVYFKWYIAPKQGSSVIDAKELTKHDQEVDHWVDDPHNVAPIPTVAEENRANYSTKTNRQSVFIRGQKQNQLLAIDASRLGNYKYLTMGIQMALRNQKLLNQTHTRNRSSVIYQNNLAGLSSSQQDLLSPLRPTSMYLPFDEYSVNGLSPDIIHPDVVPQPPISYMPFDLPLVHTMVLVTCYSEDEAGIRTTLNSICTTDYPNSHKLIVVVCDGLIKGSGNDRTTPDIVLGLMDDFVVPPEEVQAQSYVAVARGSKRHNMAKVYAGFYSYDGSLVPDEKQQRVPIVAVVKCGTPDEASSSKPGNRGKRDSQIILMEFLQKVMFDERMTALEFEFLLNIWQVTGIMAEMYECLLMVDADTMVYPDSIQHMTAEMVKDPQIMGLCGETKILNKRSSWVTIIQVFEYYISHHQAKAFESVFGGVTCLPGCFSMYRIKAPKGSNGYWVPILANPDIVERYLENVVETLHRKNLLLLGEDRYLSSLMLRTFPKRKQIFVPKAACKTVVPDAFKVLLSQRRRWINSTVHNLMELVLVKDLCGTFCFLMQFVIGIELLGTVVLPVAICLTIYVIVFAIVSHPTPIMSLILLSVVFGLPASLIVITVSNWLYVLYFIAYMLALPVWNFVLPVYAYWKFDDFSWGETRVVQGGNKGDNHNAEGEFDHSHISMKRWREYERERRNREELAVPQASWAPGTGKEMEEESII